MFYLSRQFNTEQQHNGTNATGRFGTRGHKLIMQHASKIIRKENCWRRALFSIMFPSEFDYLSDRIELHPITSDRIVLHRSHYQLQPSVPSEGGQSCIGAKNRNVCVILALRRAEKRNQMRLRLVSPSPSSSSSSSSSFVLNKRLQSPCFNFSDTINSRSFNPNWISRTDRIESIQ